MSEKRETLKRTGAGSLVICQHPGEVSAQISHVQVIIIEGDVRHLIKMLEIFGNCSFGMLWGSQPCHLPLPFV